MPPSLFSGLSLLLSQNSLALIGLNINQHTIYILTEMTLVLVLFSKTTTKTAHET